MPFRYSVEPFDVGMYNVSVVSDAYVAAFPFWGRIEQMTIDLHPDMGAQRKRSAFSGN